MYNRFLFSILLLSYLPGCPPTVLTGVHEQMVGNWVGSITRGGGGSANAVHVTFYADGRYWLQEDFPAGGKWEDAGQWGVRLMASDDVQTSGLIDMEGGESLAGRFAIESFAGDTYLNAWFNPRHDGRPATAHVAAIVISLARTQ